MYPNLGIIRAGLVCVLFFAGLPAADPPSGVANGQAQPAKIGTVDMQRAVWATAEGERASADVKGRFGPRENELAALNIRIEEIRHQLETGQTLGTAEAQQKRRFEGAHLVAQFDRKKQELTVDLRSAQEEILENLTVKIAHMVSDYAASHGFSWLFAGNEDYRTEQEGNSPFD